MPISYETNTYAHGVKTIAIEIVRDSGSNRTRVHLIDDKGSRERVLVVWGGDDALPELVLIEENKPTVTLWKDDTVAQETDA